MNEDNTSEDITSVENKEQEVSEEQPTEEQQQQQQQQQQQVPEDDVDDQVMETEEAPIESNEPTAEVGFSPVQEEVGNDSIIQEPEEPHTSFLQIPQSDKYQYTTPSKSLPPLKDIDQITTPKQFDVAKDVDDVADVTVSNVTSSPFKNILGGINEQQEELDAIDEEMKDISDDAVKAVAGYLSIDESKVREVANHSELFKALLSKSSEFQEIASQNDFLKLQLEQISNRSVKQVEVLQEKFTKADNLSTSLLQENEQLTSQCKTQENRIKELEDSNSSLRNQYDRLKESSEVTNKELDKIRESENHKELQFQQQVNQLSSTNIEQSRKLNELVKEINETRNDKFSMQLQLQKSQNELSYLKDQKEWYDNELKSVQERFTNLIIQHEKEYLMTNSKISKLTARNETLESLEKQSQETIASLSSKLEQEITKTSKHHTEFELEKSRFLKELSAKEELIELTKLQSEQRATRIQQLESYSDEIKSTLGDQISNLESKLAEKTEKVIELEERLKRTEEVLDAELHKETDLPKWTESSALIAANGISLSKIYTEYNHLKKQLVSEKAQKQKMAAQLEQFVNEFESKKPALANYRDQVKFYETSLKEMIGKVEIIRSEKAEVEKDVKRLRTRILEDENEMVGMKKLLNDLGRQLCFYLIHSRIRENQGDPLTVSEKNAIEKILAKTGNLDETSETDSDRLISERLVEFRNIIELRQKNQELLVAIRQLSKQLESHEEENNNFESVAIEEAKDAILTLEREVDSLTLKLDAATKERDALKIISDQPTSSNAEVKYLTQVNEDLRKRIDDGDKIMKSLSDQSSKTIRDLNEKLRDVTDAKNELSLKVSMVQKSAELAESRLMNCQRSLEDSRQEMSQVRKEIDFWQQQASKQESLIVEKAQELRTLESVVSKNRIAINTLEREKEFSVTLQKSLQNEVDTLKNDKIKLNEFVLNLQSLLKAREESSKELSDKLNSSIENYQNLQTKLAEKEERIQILSSQTELSLKAQNTKLEQVNEISRQLLETRTKLSEKERLVDELRRKVESAKAPISVVSQPVPAAAMSSSTSSATTQSFEINQLKEDLRNAEMQIEELTSLANASESALVNATNSFEQYKIDSDAKCEALIKEKQYVDDEVKRLQDLCNTTAQELQTAQSTHMEETNELRSKLSEYKLKADEYDNLDRDYQNKIDSIRKDLEHQIQIYNDAQNKYQLEMNQNNKLNEQINSLKNDLKERASEIEQLKKELESVKGALLAKQEMLAAEKSQLETELSISNNKITELKEQNDLLLNQMELTKASANIDEQESGDFSQVIHYLRHEKESSDAKLVVATEENQELRVRVERLQNELNITKSALSNANMINLDTSIRDHEEVSSQLEQLSILKESNTTLRQENTKKSEQISKLANQVETFNEELASAKARINELADEVAMKEQFVNLAKEENEHLKTKLSSETVTENESGEVIRLKDKLKDITTQANAKLQAQNIRIGTLQEELEALKAKTPEESTASASTEVEVSKKEMEKAKEDLAKSKEEVDQLNKKLKVSKEESSKYIAEKNNLVIQFTNKQADLKQQFNKEKDELRKSLEQEFEKKLSEAGGSNQSTADLEKKLKESQEALKEELNKEYQQKLAALNSEHEQTLKKLKAEHEKALEAREKASEQKIKMLNKKIEKLGKTATSTPNESPSTTSRPTTGALNQGSTATSFGRPSTGNSPAPTGFSQQGTAPVKPVPSQNPSMSPTPNPAGVGQKQAFTPNPPGNPFTESTLTVHRAPAKQEAPKFNPTPNTTSQNRKRFITGQPQPKNKKQKDA
ncbi:MLP1 [[Candida] subhashii]|uniref:MLP1 n=1 Tax=[Candida] subhashii TaxID=561895 RepID=A0A8J5UK61_9ASCO|nr:MLP1 [[Candida] subhashii]KAG7665178.1 MLP1 [[Candida] subhashii]